MKNDQLSMYVMGGSQTRSDSLDGGSRIFIECARRWLNSGMNIYFYTSEEGYSMLQRYGLKSIKYVIAPSSRYKKLGLYGLYAIRAIKQCVNVLKTSPGTENFIIYSGSDFLPDAIPAFLMKMRFRRAKWVAGFYLFASNPFTNETPYKGKSAVKGFIYYMSQLPIYSIVRKNADMVWVTSEPDRHKFIDNRLKQENVVALSLIHI